MLRGKCTDDPLWLKTAEQVYKETPDFGIAKNLAIKYLAQENYAKAEEWFKKALSIAPTSGDKAEMIMYLAKIEAKNGSKVAARDYCRQALSADPGLKEAYELIGDLYMNSFKDCSKEKSYAEDRLVYIAAYDMYARSGNQQKMGQAKSQFPSTTEIFEVGWKEGESKKIDWCWVGETITIRTRGKD
jgi:tetratricopeptide (TPR) repeat protein